jgi:3-oxoacyl-[acyl-carrier-protein] synthase-3
MLMLYRSTILSTGSCLPERILTNFDLEKMVDTSNEWIVERTGIHERRIAEEGEGLSWYCAAAARTAIARSGIDVLDIELIVCATVTPDMPLPATAAFIQDRIGAKNAAGFDLSAGCTGFLYAWNIADQFIRTGQYRHILVIGGELLSKYVNWSDRTTCVLFADGAGAAVLGRGQGGKGTNNGILSTKMYLDGSMSDYLTIPAGGSLSPTSSKTLEAGGHYIHMRGNETFKIAVRALTSVSKEVMEENAVRPEEINLFVPHQANTRIVKLVGEKLHIPQERIFLNIERVGNTSAGSIPIALDEAWSAGRLKSGDLVLMSAFGAGLTWAATLFRWGD